MENTIFITLEPYLAQWLKHEFGGVSPIPIRRASAEADILRLNLRTQPRHNGYKRQLKPGPNQVEILLPKFKLKDTRDNNYLTAHGEKCLHECIRTRFRVAIWKDLYTVGATLTRTKESVEHWMVAHGIEVDDKNWNTLVKMLQRCRANYCPNHRLTNHKSSKHRKKF